MITERPHSRWWTRLGPRVVVAAGALVVVLCAQAVVGTAIVDDLDAHALRVDTLGRTRMDAWRLTALVFAAHGEEPVAAVVAANDRRLASLLFGAAEAGLPGPSTAAIQERTEWLKERWTIRVRPLALAAGRSGGDPSPSLVEEVTAYVDAVDDVMDLERAWSSGQSGRFVTALAVGDGLALALMLLLLSWLRGAWARLVRVERAAVAQRGGDMAARAADPSPDEVGDVARAFDGMVADLAASRALLTTVLSSTADAILSIDETGRILSVNETALRMFGYAESDLLGADVVIVGGAPHGERHPEYLRRYLRTGEARVIGRTRELNARRRDGSEFPIDLRVTATTLGEQRVFVGVIQDVTERRGVEAERAHRMQLVSEVAARLGTASAEMLASASQLASGAEQESAAVAETLATADEVAQTTAQTAERSHAVAEAARHSAEVGDGGRAVVAAVAEHLEHLETDMGALRASIEALASRAQTIGEITTAVTEIADRTDLLALNAAIEASRAGEHGRGFTVVAAEIKELAARSKQATIEVSRQLKEIRSGAEGAAAAAVRSNDRVALVAHLAGEARVAIESLAATIGESLTTARQIAASAAQQSGGMVQIRQAIHDIENITRQTVGASRQVESSARELDEMSQHILANAASPEPPAE